MHRAMPLLLAFLLIVGFVPSAGAVEIIDTASTEKIEEIFKAEGYSYEIDSDGDLVWRLEGFKTLLIIASNKEAITFSAAFNSDSASFEKVNEWNRSKRFSKSYLDKDGDPVLQLDLDLAGGVTRTRLIDFLQTCRQSLVTWLSDVVR